MKKMVCILLACVLTASFAGCSTKEEKAEESAEEALEKVGVDADIDGDKMTIKGPDGQQVAISSGTWPESALGKSIPAFTKGSIESVVESADSLMVTIYQVDQQDAAAYIEENKPDFPLDNTEMSAEGLISWGGANDAGFKLALTHQDDCLSVTLLKEKD
ncbi:MAG: hypothetical protein GXX99_04250 [Clostridiales bacterium]|nr:hypothetical protein [Clostridiales bacterium]